MEVGMSTHSSDEAQNYAISSGRAFGSFKRKAEDDKYLKIMYKLSDILRGKIERKNQEKKKKAESDKKKGKEKNIDQFDKLVEPPMLNQVDPQR
uniref:Uncharacterized protein n=1 Tax=Glossina morsitans morsitans TaxID=37546 RepID=A0A1B0FAC0_GLOMM